MSSEVPRSAGAPSSAPASVDIARRMVARDAVAGRDGRLETSAATLERSCGRMTDTLRDTMGIDGCSALFARALARTAGAHRALKHLRDGGDGVRLDAIAASVEAHGIEDVTAAIEALIAAVVEILTRLIGEDMAVRLIDNEVSRPPTRDGAQEP